MNDMQCRSCADMPRVLPEQGNGPWVTLHEGCLARPPRQRLYPECAAAGEKIQTVRAGQVLGQPIEQGFTYPVRRGPQPWHLGKPQLAAPPAPADYAYLTGPDDR